MKAVKHFKTILIHKYYVGQGCFRLGLYWQGITHDISKLSPIEFIPSARYFTGTGSPIDAEKRHMGHSKAWQHHKGRNMHHPEYWIDNVMTPGKECVAIQMPQRYAYECLADWVGAGKAYMGKDWSPSAACNWYIAIGSKRRIHEQTLDFLGDVFLYMRKHQCDIPSKEIVDGLWEVSMTNYIEKKKIK